MAEISTLLACPRCDQLLDGWRCSACRIEFPVHAGVPWLFADPPAAISEWKNRWTLALAQLDADCAAVHAALDSATRASTRNRLERLHEGYRERRAQLIRLLEPLHLAEGGSLETLLALRTRLPASAGILSYEANVHRDWAWGTRETTAALEDLLEVAGDARPARILVLGAGAGRLAYDLHQQGDATTTVALDLSPLLTYAGHHLAHGNPLELTEFPLAPVAVEHVAIHRRLQAPATARNGLHFVLADVRRAPFREHAFDMVVTPWLLDVMDDDAALTIARINRLLAPGGLWVNQGSVAFTSRAPEQRYTLEELAEVAQELGFAKPRIIERTGPYMDCPESRHGRVETLLTLGAVRERPTDLPPRHQSLPDWIVTGRAPVPLPESFRMQAMTTRMHAFIMTLIDGQRSIRDIAAVLEEQGLMPRADAEVALRAFITTMYEEATRNSAS